VAGLDVSDDPDRSNWSADMETWPCEANSCPACFSSDTNACIRLLRRRGNRQIAVGNQSRKRDVLCSIILLRTPLPHSTDLEFAIAETSVEVLIPWSVVTLTPLNIKQFARQ
jgi:hypothetical protein